MVVRIFFYSSLYILFLFFVGCASQASKDQLLMRELIDSKNYSQAIKVLEKSELAKNKNDEILYQMELGSLYFYQGSFSEAARRWQNALELISAQYTRISTTLTSTIISDQLKEYHPKDYEISYLYYYQALAFYFEYLKTLDRKFLLQARSSIVAWDVFLQNIKIDQKFKNLYFDDFYARFFAGLIHEAIGERADLEIAYQLYQDAYQLFLLQAPTYDRYAENPDRAFKNIEELMDTLQSKEEWREKLKALATKNIKMGSEKFQQTRTLIASKIVLLAKDIRKNDVKKLQKELELDQENINYNALLIMHEDWVNPLEAKKIRLSLTAAMKDGSASQAVLATVAQAGFMVFAAKILGSGSSQSDGGTNVNFYGTGDITELSADVASLEFEIPNVARSKAFSSAEVRMDYRGANPEQEVKKTIVVQSFDDILFQTVERQKALDLMFKGTRFASKHVAAMIGAYAVYKSMVAQNADNEGLAKFAAMASYMASAKLINISENADVRYWSLLPARVSFVSFKIPSKVDELTVTKPDGTSQLFKLNSESALKNKLQILPLL